MGVLSGSDGNHTQNAGIAPDLDRSFSAQTDGRKLWFTQTLAQAPMMQRGAQRKKPPGGGFLSITGTGGNGEIRTLDEALHPILP